jgi:ABC-2 type transport system permease protein
VATMSIIILFTIIGTLDVSVFDSIRPYLFTTHMASWRSFFEDPFPIEEIKNSVWVLLSHQAAFWIISFVYFNRKDITT